MHGELSEDSKFNRRFGDLVRQHREAKSWSQRRLAQQLEDVGVKLDPSAVTRIERGTREIRLREAVAIAAVLAIDLREFPRVEQDPRAQLQSLLDSIAERRKWARSAFGGMAFYYVMAVQLLNDNPDLLEQLRIEAKMDSPFDIAEFLRVEAEMAKGSANPVTKLAVTDEEHALIEEIIAASAINITEAMTGNEPDDDGGDDEPKT
ncbi:helix-turn-helix domain-containing protein [Mycobacterium avium]|uniref:helix-turn-helix domain-containing protein n=1 Tax=Mycobacterium avium TaxID=1764 RepID=UPI001CC3F5A6|nr:helix-turn-helix transcriptional regulator [Mycobacterium avium]MBZ4620982.1 helix-turn-helix transcriptional regulator [Mycobacterium avium subsp. hominissuis]